MLNYQEATLTMIDYEGNNYQPEHRKPKRKQTNGDETVRWLNDHCDFRPFGAEW